MSAGFSQGERADETSFFAQVRLPTKPRANEGPAGPGVRVSWSHASTLAFKLRSNVLSQETTSLAMDTWWTSRWVGVRFTATRPPQQGRMWSSVPIYLIRIHR